MFSTAAAISLFHAAFVAAVFSLSAIGHSHHPAHAIMNINYYPACQRDVDNCKEKNEAFFHNDKDTF